MKKKIKLLFPLIVFSFLLILSMSKVARAATLPSTHEMEANLVSVLDEERVKGEYYPLLLLHAGKSKTPQQVVDMFDQETERFLSTLSPSESKLVRVQIVPYVAPFIRTLLANSPQERDEAIQIHRQTQRPSRNVDPNW